MAKLIEVKPSDPKLVVYDENGRPIPADGKTVKRMPYIIRRIKDGSLVEVTKQASKPKQKSGGDK